MGVEAPGDVGEVIPSPNADRAGGGGSVAMDICLACGCDRGIALPDGTVWGNLLHEYKIHLKAFEALLTRRNGAIDLVLQVGKIHTLAPSAKLRFLLRCDR
jgi:hypothetical protein